MRQVRYQEITEVERTGEYPVVATRVGGVADLVSDGVTGRLVPADDRALLSDAILAAGPHLLLLWRFGAAPIS